MPKKKKHKLPQASDTPAANVKKQLKNFNWSRLLLLVLSTIVVFSVYEALLALEEQSGMDYSITMPVFYIVTTLLVCAVIFFNHGTSKRAVTPDMLDPDLAPDEAERICARLNRHKQLAKKLMYPLIPLLMTLLLDIFYLFWGDTLRQIFSVFTGG